MSDAAGLVELREPIEEDFEIIFAMTQDPIANEMSQVYPRSREEFRARWDFREENPDGLVRTILLDGVTVGRVSCFDAEGETNVGFMICRAHWGKGVMSTALLLFLETIDQRPLLARAAKSNIGSCRVLEKCGFKKIEECESPETPRYMACVECVYLLE